MHGRRNAPKLELRNLLSTQARKNLMRSKSIFRKLFLAGFIPFGTIGAKHMSQGAEDTPGGGAGADTTTGTGGNDANTGGSGGGPVGGQGDDTLKGSEGE